MTAKEIRAKARKSLQGKWVPMILIMVAFLFVCIGCGLTAIIVFGTLLIVFLIPPIILGIHRCAMRVTRDKDLKVRDMWSGGDRFFSAVALNWLNALFIELWSMLFLIPGIIKSYAYSMSYFVLADDPRMTQDEARAESIRLMEDNKMRLFRLRLSFIGWWLLSIPTFGILGFWVSAYQLVAEAHFYEMIKKEKERPVFRPLEEQLAEGETLFENVE